MVLITLAVLSAVTFQAFATKRKKILNEDAKFVLKIKQAAQLQQADAAGVTAFKAALEKVKTNGGVYEINIHNGPSGDEDLPSPTPLARLEIKTDKITTSATTGNGSTEKLTMIQAHATQQINCNTAADIDAVVKLLK